MLDPRGKLARTLARGESLSISKRDRARLVPGEKGRVEAVRRIFSLYVDDGRGLKAIADALNRDGTPTARGPGWSHIYSKERGWRDSTVRAILLNPAYGGDMVWNRRTDARFHMIAGGRAVERKHPHGARLVPNDEADWIIVPGTHEGLVSRKVVDKAKRVRLERPTCEAQLGRPKVVGGWNGARSRFILSGLVRCSLCGARYQGVTRQKGTPRRDGTRVRTYSYACGAYITKGTSVCQYNPVGQEALEQTVIGAVLEFYKRYEGDKGRERLVAAVRQAMGVEATEIALARRRLEAERARSRQPLRPCSTTSRPATAALWRGTAESWVDLDQFLPSEFLNSVAEEVWSDQTATYVVGRTSTFSTGSRAILWIGPPGTCYPDCDGDSVLTLADFGCFQTKFGLGDPYADCDGDSVLTLADFGCFQTAFGLGCP